MTGASARVVLTGGGTGGHIYPAIAIAQTLRSRAAASPPELLFIGTSRGLEASLVPRAAIPLALVPSRPLRRALSLETLHTVAANVAGIVAALRILRRFRPDLIVATGGYVCFPVVAAARLLDAARLAGRRRKTPIALLEPNAQPGLTNRLLAPLVDEVWSAFPAPPAAAAFGAKLRYTGTPVRQTLRERPEPAAARAALGLDPAKTTVLVMGGSQGARSINEAAAQLVRRGLPAGWQLLHLSGERDYGAIRACEREAIAGGAVRLFPYLDDLAAAYAAADIAVARAGASTLAELAATGTPSLLIPYPYAAEHHQDRNAALFASAGAARILADAGLDGAQLRAALEEALHPQVLRRLRESACSLGSADPNGAINARIALLLSSGNPRT